jgi:hypothetical protein
MAIRLPQQSSHFSFFNQTKKWLTATTFHNLNQTGKMAIPNQVVGDALIL